MALKSKDLNQVRTTIAAVPIKPAQPAVTEMKNEIVRVNLNVPKALRQQWKTMAVAREMTVTELIIEAVSKYSNE